jgi:hypothetical protein
MSSNALRAFTVPLLFGALTIAAAAQMSGVTNQPYTATVKTSHVQRLADGTNITTSAPPSKPETHKVEPCASRI